MKRKSKPNKNEAKADELARPSAYFHFVGQLLCELLFFSFALVELSTAIAYGSGIVWVGLIVGVYALCLLLSLLLFSLYGAFFRRFNFSKRRIAYRIITLVLHLFFLTGSIMLIACPDINGNSTYKIILLLGYMGAIFSAFFVFYDIFQLARLHKDPLMEMNRQQDFFDDKNEEIKKKESHPDRITDPSKVIEVEAVDKKKDGDV